MTAHRFSLSLATGLVLITAASADEARGLLLRIEPDKKVIRLETRRPVRSVLDVKVDEKTQILVGRQPATLNDLSPGRRIRVVFQQRDGKPVAQVIRSFGPLALSLSPKGRGQGEGGRPAARPPAALKEGEGVGGKLLRVSSMDGEIVVLGPGAKGKETENTIAVPEETPILREGKKITLDDLREGDLVTVKTESRKGQLTAVSIQVGETVAAQPGAPPRRNIIPRLRQALQMADQLLREMEERGKAPSPERR